MTALRSTPVSSELPSPAVLLQGRNLRGSFFVFAELAGFAVCARQVCSHPLGTSPSQLVLIRGGRPDVHGLALIVGQHVRAFVSSLRFPRDVETVCSEPDSLLMSFDWQTGEFFVALAVTSIETTRCRQELTLASNTVAVLLCHCLLFAVIVPPLLVVSFRFCLCYR